jgi:hypothetical protein
MSARRAATARRGTPPTPLNRKRNQAPLDHLSDDAAERRPRRNRLRPAPNHKEGKKGHHLFGHLLTPAF